MKMRGHYCKICGEYKSNEKFSGKGHAAHICKACVFLPPEKKSEMAAINRLLNLPRDMDSLEQHMEDVPFDYPVYQDECHHRYEFGFGMGWDRVLGQGTEP